MATVVSITRFLDDEPSSVGVLSVTLADETNTYGIRRDQDGAVILAPGAATTNPAEGVYAYDWGALGLSGGFTYDAAFKVVTTSGTRYVHRAIAAAETRRTLRAYRRALVGQNQLGPYALLATSAPSPATDQLVIGNLVDSDRDAKSYNGVHAYVASGALMGQQRRVKTNGFAAASGTLTMSRPFSALADAGAAVELHSRLPATRTEDGRAGLNDCINWALEVCPQVVRLTLDAVSGQYHYGLEQFPWLTSEVQIGPVYDSADEAGMNPTAHFGGVRLRLDAELPTLEIDTPYSTGQQITVEMSVPGDRWIKTGGTWGKSDAGLVNDDDEALVDRRLLVQVALTYAYQEMAGLVEPRESDYWLRRAQAQERRSAWIRYYGQQRVKSADSGTAVVGGRRWPANSSYGRGWV